MENKRKRTGTAPLLRSPLALSAITYFSQLAQAAVMAATRASGSGGGPWADPPRDTSGGALSQVGPGLPSGPSCDA